MLTFVNGEESNAYQIATTLDERLSFVGYGFNYFQILGLSFNYEKKELEKHYAELTELMNSAEFGDDERELIKEAHRRFTSVLGSVWYEKDIDGYSMKNAKYQYEAMSNSDNMFKKIKNSLNKKIVVNYIEKVGNRYIEQKIIGELKSCDDYNNIVCNCYEDFDIDFLGEQTAILQIYDMSGNIIYSNKYLLDSKKRELYDGSEDAINGFGIASWSFYNVRKLEALRSIKSNNKGSFVKKI